MGQAEIVKVMQDGVWTILLASLPMMGVALIVGIIISIFQAATQINEQTLSFVPKIIAILLVFLLFGGFIISTVTGFTERIFAYMGTLR